MSRLGMVLMSFAIAVYTFIPPAVDLITNTHVFHPDWMPHARMHTVWLLGVTSGMGLIALYLIWSSGGDDKFRINLAGLLSTVVLGSFYLSAFSISLYGGSLSDMSGGVDKGPFGIDANLFTFTITSIVLIAGWLVSTRSRA